ncbi:MAG: sporulation integral membrane protein YtvI [Clostridium sp.]
MNLLIKRLDKIFIFFILYAVVFVVFVKTLGYTLPFVMALLSALILVKPTRHLIKRFKIPNALAALLTTITFFSTISIVVFVTISKLSQEVIQFTKGVQTYISTNPTLISDFLGRIESFYFNLDPSIIGVIESNLSSSFTKLSNLALVVSSAVLSGVIGVVTSMPYILMVTIFTFISTYYFTKDMAKGKKTLIDSISHDNNKISSTLNEAKKMLSNYLISYLMVLSVTFIVVLTGFLILRVKYAIFLSVVAAIVDVMPVLGIGSALAPLAIFYLVTGNYFTGVGLVILYLIAMITRQIVEPKIVSSSLELYPVTVLAALFIGLKANGLIGMFFCLFLVVTYKILEKVELLD